MDNFFDNELAKKFEEMIQNNDDRYFDSEELVEIIIYYLEIGDLAYAELAVGYAESLHPNSNEIKIKKLEILLEQKKYKDAKNIIDELKEFCQDNLDFIVCCAKYYSSLGKARQSISYCKKGLGLGEEDNFLNNFIADEYLNLGETKKALKYYKEALKNDLEDGYAFENCINCFIKMNQPNEGVRFLNHYLDHFPYSEMAWYQYGRLFCQQKNYVEAIKGFDFLLAINANFIGAYSYKAECYEALGKYKKAIETYTDLLELEFTKSMTYYKIGKCYLRLENMDKAMTFFRKSLVEDPQFPRPMMELSYIYEAKGLFSEALHFAKEAVNFSEENIDYQKRLALLYIENNKYEEALLCLKKITEIKPSYFYGWYAYAEVLIAVGATDKALQELAIATQVHQRAELFYQMSHCFFDLKNEVDGKKTLVKAVDLDATILKDFMNKYETIKNFIEKH